MPISREIAYVVRGTAFGRKPNAAGLQALSSEGDLVFVKKGYAARRILERALADRDGGWHCFYCGNPCANTIDHVVPRWRRRGLHMDDVGFLLGHADLKTTHRVYVHTKIADVRRRMEALDGNS